MADTPSDESGAGTTGDALVRAVLGMARREPPPALVEGTIIADTYRVVRRLGAGGMGVVYLARDLTLGRDVALKLHTVGGQVPGIERLLREAQAIAQLGHANVVTVFQIGSHAGRPFVAMEYVDGGTARTWLAARPRRWRESLELYLGAGRGLAAAHRAGLVHRDFKPDNVLVGADGRVRVADFGLVQGALRGGDEAATAGAAAAVAAPDVGDASAAAAATLTRTGAVMGTPAYMAPEQHRGEAVGPAADQFAFCVALWEALYGTRSFAGATVEELAAAIGRGPAAPRPRGVPRGVRRVLARGLAADAAARFPSLAALLTALERARDAGRRRAVAGAGLVVVGGLLAWVGLGRGAADAAAHCADAPARLVGVWDGPRRGAVRAAFLATGWPHAAETFARTAAILDRYAAGWVSARIDACRATHARHEQSAPLLDLRYHCLDERRAALGALVALFAVGPDPQVLDQAVAASLELAGLAACADVPTLAGAPPPPTATADRAAVARLEAATAEAKARLDAGKFADGAARLAAAVAADGAAPYPPAQAAALMVLAQLQSAAGEHVAAKATARAAARAAGEAHDDGQVAAVWTFLLQVVATRTNELAEAEALVPVIEAALARAGDRPAQRLTYDSALAALRQAQGRYPDAQVLLERMLATAERELGAAHPLVANALNRLASARSRQGGLDEAERLLTRAIAVQREVLGPEHPHLAMSLHNLGGVQQRAGRLAEARVTLGQALAMKERLLGPTHRDLASTVSSLGSVLRQLGQHAEAVPYFERAIAITEAASGPAHPSLARYLVNLAGAIAATGRGAEALPAFERGLALLEQGRGATHPEVATALVELAQLRAAQGDLAGARRDATRARTILEGRGAEPGDLAAALGVLADLALHDGQVDAALRAYADVIARTRAALGDAHPQVARARHAFGIAQLTIGELAGAQAELERARAGFEAALGPDHPDVARALIGLARVALRREDDAAAQPHLERAVAIVERASGASSPELAEPLTYLAQAQLYQGHAAQAVATATRALALHGAAPPEGRAPAETRFVLAQAHWAAGDDRAAALAAARAARAALAAAGVPAADLAAHDAWLARPRFE